MTDPAEPDLAIDLTSLIPAEFGFLYLGDPMCSWCWGFAPVLERLPTASACRCT